MIETNDNQHRFGGPWTEIKLGVLGSYLSAYATALKKQHFKLLYIDAFAGSGEYTPNGAPDATAGSATIALRTDGLHRYCFIEKDSSHFSQLQKVAEQFPTKSIELLQGDANEILPRIRIEPPVLYTRDTYLNTAEDERDDHTHPDRVDRADLEPDDRLHQGLARLQALLR